MSYFRKTYRSVTSLCLTSLYDFAAKHFNLTLPPRIKRTKHLCMIAAVFLPTTAFAEQAPDWKKIIHESQVFFAQCELQKAEASLIELERTFPEIRKEPLYIYQRFFIALEGRGDRATAKLMLERLNHLVAQGSLAADSSIYLSVTETWYHALFATNSDLARLAHQKMAPRRDRLAKEAKAKEEEEAKEEKEVEEAKEVEEVEEANSTPE